MSTPEEPFEEEVPLDLGPALEGYSTPGDVLRIRANVICELLDYKGYKVPLRELLEVLWAGGFNIGLDDGADVVAALKYLNYNIDPDSDEPISITRYKLSQEFK